LKCEEDYITINGSEGTYAFLKNIPYNSFQVSESHEVELLEISIDSISSSYSGFGYVSYSVYGIEALIQNNSTDTLNSIDLNTSYLTYCPPGPACYNYHNFVSFDNLNIAPGEVGTVLLGEKHIGCQYSGWTSFCVFATRPNKKLENDITDNSACAEFDEVIAVIDYIDELVQSVIEVYPNPASDFINISIEGENSLEVRMFDFTGKVYSISLGKNDIADLSAGTYYIEFTDGNKRTVKPFIKL